MDGRRGEGGGGERSELVWKGGGGVSWCGWEGGSRRVWMGGGSELGL